MLLVFCQKITPRLDYAFKHVFVTALGLELRYTKKLDTFIAHTGPKMSYGKVPLGNEFFVEATDLLFEQGIQSVPIKMKEWKTFPCFFEVSEKSKIPFDLFAASFYLLSRYEEYLPHVKDEHGRYLVTQSLAYEKNFLQMPLVDHWIAAFYEELKLNFQDLKRPKEQKERFLPLVEVVSPYKYSNKSFFRNAYQWCKAIFQLNLWEVVEHPLVLLGIRKDPWDTFEEFTTLFYEMRFKLRFFFLFSKESYLDRGISTLNTSFQSLIKGVADYFEVSLLASYPSRISGKQLGKERSNLNTLIHRSVENIRFAWGLTTVNETYRTLLAQEVRADYSLGYATLFGYRASTAVPFLFYDLANEMSTSLLIYPVVASEHAFLAQSPVNIIKQIKQFEDNLPLNSSIHCFAISNKTLENSAENEALRSVFISYLQAHDRKK